MEEQQKHEIPQTTIEHIADKHMDKNVTNAEIFEMVREFQQSSIDRNNIKLTNIGKLYWHLMKVRDERIVKRMIL